jgi:hypothetical protein
MQLRQR